jgi:hypothetical protein
VVEELELILEAQIQEAVAVEKVEHLELVLRKLVVLVL